MNKVKKAVPAIENKVKVKIGFGKGMFIEKMRKI